MMTLATQKDVKYLPEDVRNLIALYDWGAEKSHRMTNLLAAATTIQEKIQAKEAQENGVKQQDAKKSLEDKNLTGTEKKALLTEQAEKKFADTVTENLEKWAKDISVFKYSNPNDRKEYDKKFKEYKKILDNAASLELSRDFIKRDVERVLKQAKEESIKPKIRKALTLLKSLNKSYIAEDSFSKKAVAPNIKDALTPETTTQLRQEILKILKDISTKSTMFKDSIYLLENPDL
jgi:hypothetical protein